MEKIFESYINRFTTAGYYKLTNKETKYRIRNTIFWVAMTIFSLYVLNKNFGITSFLIIFVSVTFIWEIYTVLKVKEIFGSFEKKKSKKPEIIGDETRKHIEEKGQEYLKSIFVKENILNEDQINAFIDYFSEKANEAKYEGLFEKAVLGAILLPIWTSYINALFVEVTGENIKQVFLLSFGSAVVIIIIAIFLKETIGIVYADIKNADSRNYMKFKNVLINFKVNQKNNLL